MQKYVNLTDLVKSFPILIPTSIFLQKSASIQPRTRFSKFGGHSISIHLFIGLLTNNPVDLVAAVAQVSRAVLVDASSPRYALDDRFDR